MKQLVLMAHLVLIAMGTGMSFSNLVNMRLSRTQSGDVAKGLQLQRRAIARIGDGVIAFIWLSGIALVFITLAQGGSVASPAFTAKLGFVLLLTACHGLARATARRLAAGPDPALFARLEMLIGGVWLSALAAIVLAVAAFGI